VVAAGSFHAAGVLFLPPLISHSLEIGLPLLWLAGAALYGSNPPLDAARLDIMPHWLWGRAEGVRSCFGPDAIIHVMWPRRLRPRQRGQLATPRRPVNDVGCAD
jgi:hypothetical protein